VQAVALGLAGLLLVLLGAAGAVIVAVRNVADRLEAERDDAIRHLRACQRDLEQSRRLRVLEGELVVVNTPKPDDQSVRGVVRQELESGLLVLAGADYLERDHDRGRETVRVVPVGDVVVAGPKLGSWVQVLTAPPGQEA
jgi:hypothetical protein